MRDKHRTLIIEQHRKKPTLKVRREKFKNQNQVNGSFFLRNRNLGKRKRQKTKRCQKEFWEINTIFESLILAQDERWRRA